MIDISHIASAPRSSGAIFESRPTINSFFRRAFSRKTGIHFCARRASAGNAGDQAFHFLLFSLLSAIVMMAAVACFAEV